MPNRKVFVDAEPLGRVVVELRADVAPKTVNIGVCAQRGDGLTPKGPLSADFTNQLGAGRKSTYGYKFEDKNHRLERTALVSCPW